MAELFFGITHEGYGRDFDTSKPLGFCIYCGEGDLQGDVILHKASCFDCAKLTGYSEIKVLRGIAFDSREVNPNIELHIETWIVLQFLTLINDKLNLGVDGKPNRAFDGDPWAPKRANKLLRLRYRHQSWKGALGSLTAV